MVNVHLRSSFVLTFQYAVLVVLAIVFVAPFVWMVALSVRDLATYYLYPPRLLVPDPHWSNYIEVLDRLSLFQYLLNSVIVSSAIALLQLLTASMAGFAFATLSFKGRETLFMLFLANMMIPGAVILIPLFFVVRQLGLIDTYAGLILPFMFTGFGIFMMRQFFRSIPYDFFAAARVDGAGYGRIYWQIYLPLARPALATLGTLTFVFFWNTLLWPLVATNSDNLRTIPVGIANLVSQDISYPHLIMAGATIAIVPALLVFLTLQRYLIQGFVMSGVKG